MEEQLLIIIYAILFGATSTFLLIYFKRLSEGSLEYKRAKNVIEDIIFSFNKDLQRQEEKIQEITKHYEQISQKDQKVDEIEAVMADVKNRLEELMKFKEKLSANYESLKGQIDELSTKYNEILKRISRIERTSVERIELKEGTRRIKTASSTVIGRDKALASLTETELRILEILATEGEKTVPEIRSRIKLTREHTARLMKSLYMRGYVERNDNKIPYIYRLNRDMEEILKGENIKF